MTKGSFISKKESVIIQSIAVMLMVYHHLFAFPERIDCDYAIISDFSLLHLGTMLSYFGKICIAVFAFNSGYGMYKKFETLQYTNNFELLKKGYLCVFKQIKNFYIRYWIVFLAFVPLGFAIGRYSFDLKSFILSLIGYAPVYNAEWWYIKCYIIFLLCFPLIYSFEKFLGNHFRSNTISAFYILIFIIAFLIISNSIYTIDNFEVYICFISGIVCVSLNIFDKLNSIYDKFKVYRYFIAILFLISVPVVRTGLSLNCHYDFIFAPIFIFNSCIILKSNIMQKTINNVLLFVGKYSMYIWLTHTFFAYYYFQNFLYSFKYSILIFAVCMLCTTALGWIFEIIANKLINLFTFKKKV